MTNLIFATFKAYALSVMLDQANMFNEKLGWGFQKPITTNQISKCYLRPTVCGVEGDYLVGERYHVALVNGELLFLRDLPQSGRVYFDPAWNEKLERAKESITDEEAEKMCRDFLHKLNMTERELELVDPPAINHLADKNKRPLPFVEIRWKSKFDLENDPGHDAAVFDVSGVTKRVVYFLNGSSIATPRFPTPTNYYQLIGLPPGINTNWSSQNKPPKFTVEPLLWDRLAEKQKVAPHLNLSPP